LPAAPVLNFTSSGPDSSDSKEAALAPASQKEAGDASGAGPGVVGVDISVDSACLVQASGTTPRLKGSSKRPLRTHRWPAHPLECEHITCEGGGGATASAGGPSGAGPAGIHPFTCKLQIQRVRIKSS
jgi:hypothetical protein